MGILKKFIMVVLRCSGIICDLRLEKSGLKIPARPSK